MSSQYKLENHNVEEFKSQSKVKLTTYYQELMKKKRSREIEI